MAAFLYHDVILISDTLAFELYGMAMGETKAECPFMVDYGHHRCTSDIRSSSCFTALPSPVNFAALSSPVNMIKRHQQQLNDLLLSQTVSTMPIEGLWCAAGCAQLPTLLRPFPRSWNLGQRLQCSNCQLVHVCRRAVKVSLCFLAVIALRWVL